MPRIGQHSEATPQLAVWEVDAGDHVIRLAWAPNAQMLAAATISGPILILDARNGKTIHALPGHTFGNQCISWSFDGCYLATGGQDGYLKLWDSKSGRELHSLVAGAAWVEQVVFAPNEMLVLSASGRFLKLWNIEGTCLKSYPVHPSTIYDVQWQPGGLYFSSASYGQLATFRSDQIAPVKTLEWKGSILTLAYSPDGDFMATGNQDASVHFWYRKTGKDLEMSGYPTKVRELSWDSSSRYLATGGSAIVIVWDCSGKGPAGTTPIQLEAHDTLLSAVEFQNNGNLLASGCQAGRVCVWNLKKRSPLRQWQLGSAITQVRWSPDDRLLASGSAGGLIQVYDAAE
jgi:WD40 repeat protein